MLRATCIHASAKVRAYSRRSSRKYPLRAALFSSDLTGSGFTGSEADLTHVLVSPMQHLESSGVRSFSLRELCRKNSRKEAAATFYILLVLKKQSVVELSQSAPFADVTATLGPAFNAH